MESPHIYTVGDAADAASTTALEATTTLEAATTLEATEVAATAEALVDEAVLSGAASDEALGGDHVGLTCPPL